MSSPRFVHHPFPQRAAIGILLSLFVMLAACGSSNDDNEATDAEESFNDVDTASDSSDSITDDAGDAMEQDSSSDGDGEAALMEREEEAVDDAMADAPEAVSAASRVAEDSVAGGFFDSEPEAELKESNTFEDYGVRPFVETDVDPKSTFALDVDTGSFTVGKQWLENGELPPAESVRVEEYVNSFDYDYPAPNDGLSVVAEGGPSPFDANNVLVRLGVQAEQVANEERPEAALTFIVDTSGSMDRHDRLGLVKDSLTTLVRELDRDDSVAIVTYSNNAEVILEPTSVGRSDEIVAAIESLQPDGSTNLEAGLFRGYDLANEAFVEGGINRVVLASDGVANVGLTDPDQLAETIRGDADKGIHLVTVGVGMGNFNDVVMEQLADQGDGFYAYVNDRSEADRLFGDDLLSTLLTVAIDGKIQVEFSPEAVETYRLIGFENRAVLDKDFRNDDVDAGELGAGHQVTAVYELHLHDETRISDYLGTAQLRWQDPGSGGVIETRLELSAGIIEKNWANTSEDFRLAVTVASFAESLRYSPYAESVDLEQILAEAEALSHRGRVNELVDMIDQARSLR